MDENDNAKDPMKWRYARVRVHVPMTSRWGDKDNMEALQAAGAEGWEAVGVVYTDGMGTDYTVLLKKPY